MLTICSIPYNPVFFSYAIITPTTADLYIDETKLTPEAKAHLGQDVIIKPYEAIFVDAKALSAARKETGDVSSKFWLSNRASWALSESLGGEDQVEEVRGPIATAKAIKNDAELKGMRACHIRDGAALTEYFAWLENELINKKTTLDEVDAADKLEEIRSKHDLFVGLSFDTISSTGPNGAVIHYKPEKGSCSIIDPTAIYLCDSGAQYLDGTTDVTRTFHFGQPTEFERKAFTLVLKGFIGIDTAVFPKGTTGYALDVLARQALWKEGLDYLHGTGHGVGSYLVREITSTALAMCPSNFPLECSRRTYGYWHPSPVYRSSHRRWPCHLGWYTILPLPDLKQLLTSTEPGYYEDGKFGIRIESRHFP